MNDGGIPGGASFIILEKLIMDRGLEIDVQSMVPWRSMLEQAAYNNLDIVTCIYYNYDKAEKFLYSEYYSVDEGI